MMELLSTIRRFKMWNDSRGQDLVEYALVGGLIALAAIAVFPALGNELSGIFAKVITQLENTSGGTSSPAA
jgi:Flp pilus assembly pilin Flp